jgi:hypothetical protein
MDIYAKAEGFRRDMGNLDLIVNMYNAIQVTARLQNTIEYAHDDP